MTSSAAPTGWPRAISSWRRRRAWFPHCAHYYHADIIAIFTLVGVRLRSVKLLRHRLYRHADAEPLLSCPCSHSRFIGSDRGDVRCESIPQMRSEEHTSEFQSQSNLVCRLLLEKKKK